VLALPFLGVSPATVKCACQALDAFATGARRVAGAGSQRLGTADAHAFALTLAVGRARGARVRAADARPAVVALFTRIDLARCRRALSRHRRSR
jgi:hypothetical protein